MTKYVSVYETEHYYATKVKNFWWVVEKGTNNRVCYAHSKDTIIDETKRFEKNYGEGETR